MRKNVSWRWLAMPCVVALAIGCGKQEPAATPPPAAPAASSSSTSSTSADDVVPTSTTTVPNELALAADTAPETVVTAFLDATRRGDDQLAAQLLSKRALEETTRVGLAVKPPGTPSMKYAIGKIEYPAEVQDGVYVHSVWSEKFEEGEEQFDVTWVLRKQPEGWRIVGMAAQLAEDEPPFFLNFEQPEDLYRKMQEVAGPEETPDGSTGAEAAGQAVPSTAQQPGNPLR